MYLTPLKTLMVKAMQSTFATDYPVHDMASTKVSIEYPIARTNYPSIWVNYRDTDDVKKAGIGEVEMAQFINGTVNPPESTYAEYSRFTFEGTVSFTVATLSSLERDLIYDQLIRVIAIGKENPQTARFRSMVENNRYLAVNARYDQLATSGTSESPGTPWGTDEIIYETTIDFHVLGEFWIAPESGDLVDLTKIDLLPPVLYLTGEGPDSVDMTI